MHCEQIAESKKVKSECQRTKKQSTAKAKHSTATMPIRTIRYPKQSRREAPKQRPSKEQLQRETASATMKRLPKKRAIVNPFERLFFIVTIFFRPGILQATCIKGISFLIGRRGHHRPPLPCPASKAPTWKPLPP